MESSGEYLPSLNEVVGFNPSTRKRKKKKKGKSHIKFKYKQLQRAGHESQPS